MRRWRPTVADSLPKPTPLERAQRRVAFALAEKQLQGHRGRGLAAEIRHFQIALWIEAKLEYGGRLEDAVWDAADFFNVSDRLAWKAWKRSATVLNRQIVAK